MDGGITIGRASMGLRHLFAASLAASIVLTVPAGAAFGAPTADRQPGGTATAADDPPDTEIPSDPEELPPPPEASILEKENAGLVAGIPASSWEEYAKVDYQFTISLWRTAVYDTEVRAGAELALGTYDPETQRCDACTTFIRTNIFVANDRDIRQETHDQTQAFEARYRRQAVADMVDYTFPNASAVGAGDRNFIFAIWQHLRATKPWATRSIAAAAVAVTAAPDERIEFLASFGTVHFYPDQRQHLQDEAGDDLELLKDLERRAKRKAAGIAIGVSFGQPGNEDQKWYLVDDGDFLNYLYDEALKKDPYFHRDVIAAIAVVLNDEGAAGFRAFIDNGIHKAAAKDADRRKRDRYNAAVAAVTALRDEAVGLGLKNRALAASAALAAALPEGKMRPLDDFQRTYDQLPPDASDMTVFYDYGTAPSGMWVFGHVGRKAGSGTARRVWTSPAGWRALNAQAVLGEFDGKPGQDAAALYKVANLSYRIEVFPQVDSPSGPPKTVWELKPTSATVGWTLQTPVATDVNADGRTDIVVYGTDPLKKPVLMTLFGEADGTFRQQVLSVPVALVTGRVVAGDVSGDRKGDLVTFVQHATEGAQMWVSVAGDNGYATPVKRWSNTTVKLAEAGTPVIGDFDKDNRAEAAIFRKETVTTASLWLFDNIATGTVSFGKKWTSPTGWTFDGLFPVATDVNGDARTDLAVVQRNDAAKTSVWAIRAKPGGFDPATPAWTSAKGSWRTANTRIAR
jgi:hypothetical protein